MARHEHGRGIVLKVIFCLIILGVLVYAGIMGYVAIRESGVSQTVPEPETYDAIVILGAQVKPDGEPSVQLAWRLDAGLEAWRNKNVPVVVCGARGGDEPATEASVMKAYLSGKGVSEEQIFMDDSSFNTNQNLANAAKILTELGIQKCLIVTSDYHVPRSLAIAGDAGIAAVGMGSPCKPEFWLKNHAREALAWCKYWAIKYLRVPLE